MRELIDNGGPAFPVPEISQAHFGTDDAYPGLSIRDYFAAKAMQSLIARVPYNNPAGVDRDVAAIAAYEFADAMLEARQK